MILPNPQVDSRQNNGRQNARYPEPQQIIVLAYVLLVGLTLIGCQNRSDSNAPPDAPAPSQDSASASIQFPDTPISTEDSNWQSQFAAVLDGADDTLLIADRAITAEQLGQLVQLDGPLEQLLIDAGGVDDDSLTGILAVKSLVHLRLRECSLGDPGFMQIGASGL
ncbi:MAG: hypothetical protein ABI557_01545, partial [Aureliella sp.]